MDILLLEDDQILAQSLQELLEDEGYSVDVVYDGEEALDYSYKNDYKLYIFDVNVPEIDGFELLKSLRDAEDKTPAIFMTALVDIKSMAEGFNAGADDYIKKPFDPDELLIRIKAKVTQNNSKINYLNLDYDPLSKELYQDGMLANLSETQLLIFDLLIQNINHVIDKEQLLDLLNIASDASLRVHVNKLKSRLGIEIRNVRGVGYMIEKI